MTFQWTTILTRNCGRLWHIIRARYPNWKLSGTQVSPDAVVVQTIGVLFKENIYKTACISKNNNLTSPLSLCSLLLSFKTPSPEKSIIIILEYTSSNCVKLLDHLSDLLGTL